MSKLRTPMNHARLAMWVEHMKGVYQRTIDKHAASGRMEGGDIRRVKNHIECLSMIQTLLREHAEMADGRAFDPGSTIFSLSTIATLIKPNGERLVIPRKAASEASGSGSATP